MRGKRSFRRLCTGLILLAVGLLSIAPAGANFGSSGNSGTSGTTNGVWLTNNDNFHVYKRNLTATYAAGVDDTIYNDYDTIPGWDADTVTASSCNDTGADTCAYDSDYGDNGLNGWNACAGTTSGSHPDRVCSVQWVRFNEFYSPPATRIACHEIAHSVGLRHTNASASCVKRTADGGTSSTLSAHDRSHLDNEY